MTTSEQSILEILDRYRSAVAAKDVDAFAALYDDEVLVFDLWGRWCHRGLAAWRAMAAQWFGSLADDERVLVEFSDTQVAVAHDLATAHAFVTYRAVSASGTHRRSLDNRLSATLRLKDGRWKIVHEHTSAPVDTDSGRVQLQR